MLCVARTYMTDDSRIFHSALFASSRPRDMTIKVFFAATSVSPTGHVFFHLIHRINILSKSLFFNTSRLHTFVHTFVHIRVSAALVRTATVVAGYERRERHWTIATAKRGTPHARSFSFGESTVLGDSLSSSRTGRRRTGRRFSLYVSGVPQEFHQKVVSQ